MKKMKTKTNPYFTKSVDGKRSFSRDRRKRGVSPVIGVILMVAATIVIAAVVLAMLGGFGPPRKSYTVAVTAARTPDGNVTVTNIGGPDAAYLSTISVSVPGGTPNPLTLGKAVGSTNTTTAITSTAPNEHVTATATFTDGTSQVVLDTYV
jgi:flagellin-like protein